MNTFFKYIVALTLCASSSIFAQDAPPAAQLSKQDALNLVGQDFAKQAMTVDSSQALQPSEFIRDDQFAAAAADIGMVTKPQENPLTLRGQGQSACTDSGKPGSGQSSCSNPRKSGKYIFVSLSMTEQQRRQAIEYANETDASLIVIGIEEPDTFTSYFAKWQPDFDSVEPESFLFDPRLYKIYGITTVPSVVIVSDDKVAKAVGTANAIWLQDQIDLYGYKDFGTVGESKNHSEIDLIEHFQQRAAQVNWDEIKSNVGKNFWKKFSHIDLPTASTDKQFMIDPTSIRTRDLKSQDGKVLAAAGERINPLDTTVLTKQYIVADGNNQKQMEWVVLRIKKNAQEGKPTTLLLTRFKQGEEFKNYHSLMRDLGTAVYLYTPDVHRTFQVDALPALVHQSGNKLLVSQFKPEL